MHDGDLCGLKAWCRDCHAEIPGSVPGRVDLETELLYIGIGLGVSMCMCAVPLVQPILVWGQRLFCDFIIIMI